MLTNHLHDASCALHNGPAYPTGDCDCGQNADRKPIEDAKRSAYDTGLAASSPAAEVKQ